MSLYPLRDGSTKQVRILWPKMNALTAIGQTIALERAINPTKSSAPTNAQGSGKGRPPTQKQLPVEVDILEYIASLGQLPTATKLDKAIGDLSLIAF